MNEPTFQESIPAQKQEEQHIRAQHDLALALNATTNLKQGLELCLETALTVSGMDCGGIYVVDETSNTLELLAYRGLRPEFIECSSSYDSESANYILVMRGTPVYCTYSELDLPKNQVHRNEGLRSFALIPVQYEKQIICCLNLASHTSDQIDKNSRDVLETIAAQIASAIARLKVETELRESEDKYRELFELESDAIFLIRNDTGRIIEANSAATSLYGYTHRELLSLKNTDLSAEPEDTRRVTTTTPVLKDTIIKIPLRFHRKKDGTVFPVEITGRFFSRKGHAVHIAAIRDISERRRAEEILKQSEQALRERIAFEQMLAEISNAFFYHSDEDLEPLVTHGLRRVVEFLQLERGSLFELSPDGRNFKVIYYYAVPGFSPSKPVMTEDEFPYYVEMLKKGSYVYYEDIDKAPPQAGLEKEFCSRAGIHAVMSLPLMSGDTVKGALTFISTKRARQWPQELHDRLRLIGELFLNVILRKKAEIGLNRLFRYSMDMLCIKGFDGYFKQLNPAFEKTLGWSREEILAMSFFDLIHPDDMQATLETAKNLQKGLEATGVVNRCRCKDGNYKWIMWNSFPLPNEGLIFAVAHDITTRKKSEDALAAQKERLSVTLRSIADAVISTDVTGHIMLMNSVAEELTGWTDTEARGEPLNKVFRIFNEETGEPCPDPIERVVKSGAHVSSGDFTKLVSRDGTEYIITDSAAPIKDAAEAIAGAVIVFRDNTEKFKIEQNMMKTQKLESLGLLAGGIAHDFNNLLSGIFGYIDMAREQIRADQVSQADDLLSKAMLVFDRAKGLTQQLLTFARGGEPVRNTGNLGKTVFQTVQFALSGSNVRGEFDLAENLWLCDFDANQIGQAVDNIAINAKQAMPEGGLLRVAAENIVITKTTHLPLAPGQYIHLSFRDQGRGISKEQLEKIFDPFFTTKKSGSGLGLTTCYSIIKKHDGHIEVESSPNRGTLVSLYLPASKATGPRQTSVESSKPREACGKILVMDDEDYIREVMVKMLTNMGCTAVTTRNAEETIDAFKKAIEQEEPFCAVILDLTIPGGAGGREVVSKLLEIDPDAYIIASSGYSEDPVMADPVKYGFKSRIGKPFRMADLREKLEPALNK